MTRNKETARQDMQSKLMSGSAMEVKRVGKIHPLTLREIGEAGEATYNEYLSLLSFDRSILADRLGDKIKDLSSFGILVENMRHNKDMREDMENALALFLKERVVFIPDQLVLFVGSMSDSRYIHEENYQEIVDILKMQNCIQAKPKNEKPKMSPKARKLLEKRNKGRNLLKKARGQEDTITLSDLISIMGVFTGNIDKVLDWTVYQLHDQYQKFMGRERYSNNFEMYLVGADPKKLDLEAHWTSKKI